MNKLCRQVSIESPGPVLSECVLNYDIPVPETPPQGALLRVAYAGACYRPSRDRSMSLDSMGSDMNVCGLAHGPAPAHIGLCDGALFPGYEISGIVESIGENAENPAGLEEGSRIVLYPPSGTPNGYADYIVVNDLKGLVSVPRELSLSVAAMLPTGALLAMNTVFTASHFLKTAFEEFPRREKATVLIVGTGGLALWALRIATLHFRNTEYCDKVAIFIASLNNDGFALAREIPNVVVIHWAENLYEKQLIERTTDACGGKVDIIMNFGTNSRALHRSMQCLSPGGIVLITEEVGERLMPKFSKKAEEMQVRIVVVPNGSIEQLRELVGLVTAGEIVPPPHSVFPAEQAQEVIRLLCASEINGRAILKFLDVN